MKFIYLFSVFFLSVSGLISQDLMKSIYFGEGSYYIDNFQIQELDKFIKEIPNIHLYELEIHGHTDDIGSIEYNNWLSQMRTSEVYYLLSKFPYLKREQIQGIDFGELEPTFDNATMEGKLRNRRVDIIIRRIAS